MRGAAQIAAGSGHPSCRSTIQTPRRRQVSIARARASPARSSRHPARPASASNTCSPPPRWNRISIRPPAPSTSSAHGLYQFIDQTWLGTVKEAGGQLGYGQYADAITKTSSGDYTVDDPGMKRSIMKLRDDPEAASGMAGGADAVQQFQAHRPDRPPADRQRALHGAFHGRRRRGQADRQCRGQSAGVGARLFPNAAAANRSIFYDQARPRAQRLRSLFGAERALCQRGEFATTRSAMAMYGDTPSTTQVASANGVQPSRCRRSTAPPISQTFPMRAA